MTSMNLLSLLWIVAALVLGVLTPSSHGMSEQHRVQEHRKRYGNDWPPPYVPNTKGWKELMEKRLAQVAAIEDRHEKYDGWMQTVTQAFVAPNFTEYGFGVVKAPEDLTETLQEAIRGGLERGEATHEHEIFAIEGPNPCLFIRRPDLTKRVVEELQPYTEAWAGMKLQKALAYGFRLYQDGSTLNMHVDKSQTHIISMIYHIDHSDDSEPWPVFIEDFDGNTHEVVLERGQILFYESSKCLHGRPTTFHGSWYTSVFVHYYPADDWMDVDHSMESHYAVPPGWDKVVPLEQGVPPLTIKGTSFKEPSCPHSWCNAEKSIQWSAPLIDDFWIDATGARHPFEPRLFELEDEEDEEDEEL